MVTQIHSMCRTERIKNMGGLPGGVHRSVGALHAAIYAFIEQHNSEQRPFRWTKSADHILRSIERFCTYNTRPPAT